MHFEKKPPTIITATVQFRDGGRTLLRYWAVHLPGHRPALYGAVGELILNREGNEIAALQPMVDRPEESELLELSYQARVAQYFPVEIQFTYWEENRNDERQDGAF